MKYNILFIADLHWGAEDVEKMESALNKVFLNFIEKFKKIDLVVFGGDFWNSKFSLNSTISITAINWVQKELINMQKRFNFKIRFIVGTRSHDYDQLNVFKNLESDNFKIFERNTLEETLPNLWAIYCPDENISNDEYYQIYSDNLLNEKDINIGFFHGNFDYVLGNFGKLETENEGINNIIFEYNYWEKIIHGPLLSGHYHRYLNYNHYYSVGSFERFGFGEEHPKGFLFVMYDTDSYEYYVKFIENKLATEYKTFSVDTSIFKEIKDYNKIINIIEDYLINKPTAKIRIKIYITNDNPENDIRIELIKNVFINEKRVKVVLINKLKEKAKKQKREEFKKEEDKYAFADDPNLDEAKKIQMFIQVKQGVEIPIEIIEKYTSITKNKMKVGEK